MEERKVVKKVVFRPCCGEGGGPILCIAEKEPTEKVGPETSKPPKKVSPYDIFRDISNNNSPT